MFEEFSYWLFLFFLFSVMGWVLETTIESLYYRRFINRGFLFGPYIPIYGVGGIMLANIGQPFKWNPFLAYIVGALACTVLEYMIGGILERIFKKQFWDYSMMNFTYKNRISLVSSMFWGIMTLFMTYVLYDFISPLVRRVNYTVMVGIDISMTLIMGVDAFFQVKRQLSIEKILAKLTREQARKSLDAVLMRIGNMKQIRDVLNRIRLARYFKSLNSEGENNSEEQQ